MLRLPQVFTAVTLVCSACDYVVLSTRVGEHVVYHWDAGEHQLCGGTVTYTDRVVEVMTAHYALPLESAGGPSIEYFWALDNIGADLCGSSAECTLPTPSTRPRWAVSIFADTPIHRHELAHAAVQFSDHGLPSFIGEGLASRWGSDVLGGPSLPSQPFTLTENELRTRIDRWFTELTDYSAAFSWWAALEANFGPLKMGEFITALDYSSSPDDVDAALKQTLGITLAESVELASTQGTVSFEAVDCELAGLPRLVWTGAPIVLERANAQCNDGDVVNWHSRVVWPFLIEFRDSVEVEMRVNADNSSQGLRLVACQGEPSSQPAPLVGVFTSETRVLNGRYIGNLLGDLKPDGSVVFPHVTIEAR